MSAAETNAQLDAGVLAFDAGQGQRMIKAVHGFLGRFVSYPNEHAHTAHALWIVHAHLMDRWDSTPRIAFLSPEPASGKSRALEVTERLVPNPVVVVNVSPAYLFRKVASDEGATILFDEIDAVFGPKAKDNEDLRALLNAGHRQGATAGRCVTRGREVFVEELPAYAAVALAGLGWLPDTLLSRSIVIRMQRRHRGESIEAFRPRLHESEGWRVRDTIAAWADAAPSQIDWPEQLPSGITDRNADVWEPLIAIADLIGGSWPALARAAAVAFVADDTGAEPSLGIRLLGDLRMVFEDHEEMSTKSMLDALRAIEEAPWSDLRGKPLDARGLAHRLRQYGLTPKSVRIGTTTPKGYVRADFVDLWDRYLPPAPTSATSATAATVPPVPTPRPAAGVGSFHCLAHDVADVADVAAPGGDGRACIHCGLSGGAFCEASVAGEPVDLHVSCVRDYRL